MVVSETVVTLPSVVVVLAVVVEVVKEVVGIVVVVSVVVVTVVFSAATGRQRLQARIRKQWNNC